MLSRTEYLLNIGRNRNDCPVMLEWRDVVAALHERGLHVVDMQERTSSTERTFVVLVSDRLSVLPYCRGRFTGLANDLHQDCIAAVLLKSAHHGEWGEFSGPGIMGGELFGAGAAKWGPYKAEYFLVFA
ncbi:hypothetical protein [Ralstonia phage vB_RsoP_BMB50]|uniref:Uncharacterized protein n=1 Tax=Ralstonia phage vB_RsoP_BMB50 TaxID=2834269 RepID=A0A8E5NVH6_9CAUD|nr:hypothetical protein [Ralstonia phage vB_RsoP_BMB50]